MSSRPISLTVFDPYDNPVFSTTNCTGYIPRASERLSINKIGYRVNNVEYIYGERELLEVHVLAVPLR